MDRFEALIAVAHRRLALRRFLMAIEKNPHLLGDDMALKIKKPIELVGLKSRMIRAEGQEKAIATIGVRYDKVQDGIDELTAAHSEHVGELEHYESDLRRKIEGMVGSNGDPTDGQAGLKSDGGGQVISSETKV